MDQIKPITYLKNHAAELVGRLAEEGGTVTITQKGEAKAVVMDIETYRRWRNALALLKIAALGEADIAGGRTVAQETAFARARNALKAAVEDG